MAIEGIGGIGAALPVGGATPAAPAAGAGFGEALGKALAQVDALQQAGDQQAAAVAHGAGNLHEVSLALAKADIAMRVAEKVRTKLVETYQEVMRMPV